jgi:hypothetical protein
VSGERVAELAIAHAAFWAMEAPEGLVGHNASSCGRTFHLGGHARVAQGRGGRPVALNGVVSPVSGSSANTQRWGGSARKPLAAGAPGSASPRTASAPVSRYRRAVAALRQIGEVFLSKRHVPAAVFDRLDQRMMIRGLPSPGSRSNTSRSGRVGATSSAPQASVR